MAGVHGEVAGGRGVMAGDCGEVAGDCGEVAGGRGVMAGSRGEVAESRGGMKWVEGAGWEVIGFPLITLPGVVYYGLGEKVRQGDNAS